MDALTRLLQFSLAVLAAFAVASSASAADDVDVQTLVTGLKNPTGVAIRPSSKPATAVTGAKEAQGPVSYEIVVCESGAGRVRSVESDQPDKLADLITGFPALSSGAGRSDVKANAAVGVTFLDFHRVVVGSGDARQPTLRLYDIGGIAIPPIASEKPTQVVHLPRGDRPSKATAATGYSLTRTIANDKVADLLIVSASRGTDGSGLWKVLMRADTLDKSEMVQAADEAASVNYLASTVNPSGYLVAIETGQASVQQRLVFLNPIDATVVMRVPLDLPDVSALAYSPRTKNLYAAASGNAESAGGIYRLDSTGATDKSAVAAVKVADVDRPSALVFGPDGPLYVTDLSNDGAHKGSSGSLLKLTGEL